MRCAPSRVACLVVASGVAVGLAGCGANPVPLPPPPSTSAPSPSSAGAPTPQSTPMPQDVAQGDDDAALTTAIDDADRAASAAESDLADPDG